MIDKPPTGLVLRWRQRLTALQTEVYAIYLAYKDPRVSWYARLFAAAVVAYAFSPLDLIPDPIPILGYLDDLLLVPLGVWLALKMIPAEVVADCRVQAQATVAEGLPVYRGAAVFVVATWVFTAVALLFLATR